MSRTCVFAAIAALVILNSYTAFAAQSYDELTTEQKIASLKEVLGNQVPGADYLGWMPDYKGFTNIASAQVAAGVRSFYRSYERWPTSWAEVVAVGAWQAPLATGYNGEKINPDDGTIDFPGDVFYDPVRAVVEFGHAESAGAGVLGPVTTYREHFEKMKASGATDAELNRWTGTPEQQSYFAILGGLKEMVLMYYTLKQDVPETFTEFIATGFAPINAESINPMTGRPFAGDGSALDVSYRYQVIPAGSVMTLNGEQHPRKETSTVTITHVLPNGKRPRLLVPF